MAVSLKLSVLDLVSMWDGASAGAAINESVELAKYVESLGYTRFWYAEHHNAPWQASSAPEILIAHTAAATTTLRVGSGGVMLPNHSPLKVVENFRTLEAMYGGRIDLGLGRAPGTDGRTALALRRSTDALTANDFPEHVEDLLAFFTGTFPAGHVFQPITPTPVVDSMPEVWILGSSDFGARFAAKNGLGFAFAHHIAPENAIPMLRIYRETFQPSPFLAEPRSILASSVFASDDPEQAADAAALVQLVWARLRRGDIHAPPPTLADARTFRAQSYSTLTLNPVERGVIGTTDEVEAKLRALADAAQVDELMLMTMMPDFAQRRESYRLVAERFGVVPKV